MSDDELDRHLRAVLASVIPPSASLSETFEKLLAARDRLRLAIDAAVRAEREACATLCENEANMRREREQTFFRDGAEFDGRIQGHKSVTASALAAAIRNRSNT